MALSMYFQKSMPGSWSRQNLCIVGRLWVSKHVSNNCHTSYQKGCTAYMIHGIAIQAHTRKLFDIVRDLRGRDLRD